MVSGASCAKMDESVFLLTAVSSSSPMCGSSDPRADLSWLIPVDDLYPPLKEVSSGGEPNNNVLKAMPVSGMPEILGTSERRSDLNVAPPHPVEGLTSLPDDRNDGETVGKVGDNAIDFIMDDGQILFRLNTKHFEVHPRKKSKNVCFPVPNSSTPSLEVNIVQTNMENTDAHNSIRSKVNSDVADDSLRADTRSNGISGPQAILSSLPNTTVSGPQAILSDLPNTTVSSPSLVRGLPAVPSDSPGSRVRVDGNRNIARPSCGLPSGQQSEIVSQVNNPKPKSSAVVQESHLQSQPGVDIDALIPFCDCDILQASTVSVSLFLRGGVCVELDNLSYVVICGKRITAFHNNDDIYVSIGELKERGLIAKDVPRLTKRSGLPALTKTELEYLVQTKAVANRMQRKCITLSELRSYFKLDTTHWGHKFSSKAACVSWYSFPIGHTCPRVAELSQEQSHECPGCSREELQPASSQSQSQMCAKCSTAGSVRPPGTTAVQSSQLPTSSTQTRVPSSSLHSQLTVADRVCVEEQTSFVVVQDNQRCSVHVGFLQIDKHKVCAFRNNGVTHVNCQHLTTFLQRFPWKNMHEMAESLSICFMAAPAPVTQYFVRHCYPVALLMASVYCTLDDLKCIACFSIGQMNSTDFLVLNPMLTLIAQKQFTELFQTDQRQADPAAEPPPTGLSSVGEGWGSTSMPGDLARAVPPQGETTQRVTICHDTKQLLPGDYNVNEYEAFTDYFGTSGIYRLMKPPSTLASSVNDDHSSKMNKSMDILSIATEQILSSSDLQEVTLIGDENAVGCHGDENVVGSRGDENAVGSHGDEDAVGSHGYENAVGSHGDMDRSHEPSEQDVSGIARGTFRLQPVVDKPVSESLQIMGDLLDSVQKVPATSSDVGRYSGTTVKSVVSRGNVPGADCNVGNSHNIMMQTEGGAMFECTPLGLLEELVHAPVTSSSSSSSSLLAASQIASSLVTSSPISSSLASIMSPLTTSPIVSTFNAFNAMSPVMSSLMTSPLSSSLINALLPASPITFPAVTKPGQQSTGTNAGPYCLENASDSGISESSGCSRNPKGDMQCPDILIPEVLGSSFVRLPNEPSPSKESSVSTKAEANVSRFSQSVVDFHGCVSATDNQSTANARNNGVLEARIGSPSKRICSPGAVRTDVADIYNKLVDCEVPDRLSMLACAAQAVGELGSESVSVNVAGSVRGGAKTTGVVDESLCSLGQAADELESESASVDVVGSVRGGAKTTDVVDESLCCLGQAVDSSASLKMVIKATGIVQEEVELCSVPRISSVVGDKGKSITLSSPMLDHFDQLQHGHQSSNQEGKALDSIHLKLSKIIQLKNEESVSDSQLESSAPSTMKTSDESRQNKAEVPLPHMKTSDESRQNKAEAPLPHRKTSDESRQNKAEAPLPHRKTSDESRQNHAEAPLPHKKDLSETKCLPVYSDGVPLCENPFEVSLQPSSCKLPTVTGRKIRDAVVRGPTCKKRKIHLTPHQKSKKMRKNEQETATNEHPKETCTNEHPKETCRNEHPKETCTNEHPKETCRKEYSKEICRNEHPNETSTTEHPKETCRNEHPKETCRNEHLEETCRNEYPKDTGRNEHPKETCTDESKEEDAVDPRQEMGGNRRHQEMDIIITTAQRSDRAGQSVGSDRHDWTTSQNSPAQRSDRAGQRVGSDRHDGTTSQNSPAQRSDRAGQRVGSDRHDWTTSQSSPAQRSDRAGQRVGSDRHDWTTLLSSADVQKLVAVLGGVRVCRVTPTEGTRAVEFQVELDMMVVKMFGAGEDAQDRLVDRVRRLVRVVGLLTHLQKRAAAKVTQNLGRRTTSGGKLRKRRTTGPSRKPVQRETSAPDTCPPTDAVQGTGDQPSSPDVCCVEETSIVADPHSACSDSSCSEDSPALTVHRPCRERPIASPEMHIIQTSLERDLALSDSEVSSTSWKNLSSRDDSPSLTPVKSDQSHAIEVRVEYMSESTSIDSTLVTESEDLTSTGPSEVAMCEASECIAFNTGHDRVDVSVAGELSDGQRDENSNMLVKLRPSRVGIACSEVNSYRGENRLEPSLSELDATLGARQDVKEESVPDVSSELSDTSRDITLTSVADSQGINSTSCDNFGASPTVCTNPLEVCKVKVRPVELTAVTMVTAHVDSDTDEDSGDVTIYTDSESDIECNLQSRLDAGCGIARTEALSKRIESIEKTKLFLSKNERSFANNERSSPKEFGCCHRDQFQMSSPSTTDADSGVVPTGTLNKGELSTPNSGKSAKNKASPLKSKSCPNKKASPKTSESGQRNKLKRVSPSKKKSDAINNGKWSSTRKHSSELKSFETKDMSKPDLRKPKMLLPDLKTNSMGNAKTSRGEMKGKRKRLALADVLPRKKKRK